MDPKFQFVMPEFDYEQFARHMYYKHLEELEAFGIALESFEEYNSRNEKFLRERYEHFLSES
jgi:predicted GNAT superfamily acetyltransferase